MVIVLVAQRVSQLLEWIMRGTYSEIESTGIIKQQGAYTYLYIETFLEFNDVERQLKRAIVSGGGSSYVYQFYPIYQGLIDYMPYLSEESKKKKRYYQRVDQDITKKEIEDYIKKISH